MNQKKKLKALGEDDFLKIKVKEESKLRIIKKQVNVEIDNKSSATYTILIVKTNNRPNLLYDISKILIKNKIIISMAKISTNGDFVEDSFHLRSQYGLKVKDNNIIQTLVNEIKNKLKEKLENVILKIISIVGSLTFLSRILGYMRDLLIARVIGAGMVSDCFFVSFKLPNLFRRLFGEGAMNSAFIPVVSGIRSKSGRKNSDIFFSKILSILIVFLLFFVIFAEIFMPLIITLIAPGFLQNLEKFELSIELSRLSFPFVFFICLTSLMGAYLNTLGKFASMAVTPVILNLSLIFVLLFFSVARIKFKYLPF